MQKELQRTKAVFAVQALWRQHHTQEQNQGKLPQDLQKSFPQAHPVQVLFSCAKDLECMQCLHSFMKHDHKILRNGKEADQDRDHQQERQRRRHRIFLRIGIFICH